VTQATRERGSINDAATAYPFPDFGEPSGSAVPPDDGKPRNGTCTYRIELGRTSLTLEATRGLRRGNVVALENSVDAPVDIYADDIMVARGDLFVAGGEIRVRVTTILRD